MKTLIVATILLIFSDNTTNTKAVNFYTFQDCNKFISQQNKEYKKGEEVMFLDDNLVWTYKKVEKVVTYCQDSGLTVEKMK